MKEWGWLSRGAHAKKAPRTEKSCVCQEDLQSPQGMEAEGEGAPAGAARQGVKLGGRDWRVGGKGNTAYLLIRFVKLSLMFISLIEKSSLFFPIVTFLLM